MAPTDLVLVAASLFAGLAAGFDWRTGHIPNRLVVAGFAAGVTLHFAVHVVWLRNPGEPLFDVVGAAALNVVLGILATGLVPWLLFTQNAIGGGDVKLLAALGAFLGPIIGLELELFAFVLVALYAPARLAYEGRLLRTMSNSALLLVNPLLPKARRREIAPELLTSLRFGPAVFAGALFVSFQHWGTG